MGTLATGELNKALDALVGRASYTANAAVYAKLHLGDPGAAGTSNPAVETTRALVTFGDAAASGTISNTAAVEWTNVSTSETYTWVSFWTASSGGTFLGRDDLSSSAAMTAGQTFRLPIGDLDVSIGTVGDGIAVGERNKMLDAWAGRATYTANAAYCLKLHVGDPGVGGTSNAAGETTRKAITFGSAAASASISNTTVIEWTSYPNNTDDVTHVSAWTATSGGTWLGNDALPATQAMETGEILRIAIGGVVVTLPDS